MARIFLDYNWETTSSGARIYAVFFNDTTKLVEADFVKNYDVLADDFTVYAPVYGYGQSMYDQCLGADRYQVFKKQSLPFGDVVLTVNSPTCATGVLNSALYRFNSAGGDELGDVAGDVCDFEGAAYLYFVGALQIGSEVYIDTEETLLPYSGSGWFRIGTTAYQINSSSEIVTITPSFCEVVAPLPDPEPLPDLVFGAFLHLPQATSLRFVRDHVGGAATADNRLFAVYRSAGVIAKPFDQVVKRAEELTIQFGSSYPTNVVKLYNAATGALVDTIEPTLVRENLNQVLEVPGFAVSDSQIVGIQVWFPNYPFPDFAKQGNKINIAGTQVNGQYNVISVQDGRGLAKGNRVLIADFTIPTPGSTPVEVTGKYNADPYNVYEAVLNVATAGRYYAVIECSGGGFDPASATSEPFVLTEELDEYLEISYTNDEDAYGCYYGSGLTHRLWIKSRTYKTLPGGEKTINRETTARLVKNDEFITKSLSWECFTLPPYLVTQLSIALAHDEIRVNSILVQTPDQPEVEYYLPSPFATLTVELEEVEFTERNREAGSIDSSDSYLLINAGNRLLINP